MKQRNSYLNNPLDEGVLTQSIMRKLPREVRLVLSHPPVQNLADLEKRLQYLQEIYLHYNNYAANRDDNEIPERKETYHPQRQSRKRYSPPEKRQTNFKRNFMRSYEESKTRGSPRFKNKNFNRQVAFEEKRDWKRPSVGGTNNRYDTSRNRPFPVRNGVENMRRNQTENIRENMANKKPKADPEKSEENWEKQQKGYGGKPESPPSRQWQLRAPIKINTGFIGKTEADM